MANPPHTMIGRSINQRYKIESLLGQGGMSAVYLATDQNLQRKVAVKLIHPHLSDDADFLRRFRQEAQAVAQLNHNNIYHVHDFDYDGTHYYMVMEYVRGQTLEQHLARFADSERRLTISSTIKVMSQICDAVDYAHRRGMIHRDLKPSNVMIADKGRPILMDFGIAKLLGQRAHTSAGSTVGTAAYMSPEQARSDAIDHRSDIYALGVILYEMITNQRPFSGETAMSVMYKHVNEPPPRLSEIDPDRPEALETIVQTALAKAPGDRFQTASAMADALRQVTTPDQSSEIRSAVAPAAALRRPEAVKAKPKRQRRLTWVYVGLAGVVGLMALAVIAAGAFYFLNTDDVLPAADNMVQVPAGNYQLGQDNASASYASAQTVRLEAFWIDQYEVTNAQYATFLAAEAVERPAGWSESQPPAGRDDHPVSGITFEAAAAYCDWVAKRLPTESEWEAAARGRESRLYPWGDDAALVELPRGDTYPVGNILGNRSSNNVYDMAGNVWEWVVEPYEAIADGEAVLRGGQFGLVRDSAYRLVGNPDSNSFYGTAGIRCAASAVSDPPTTTVLYEDDFTDIERGWPTSAQDNALFGYHPPDFYHVEVSQAENQVVALRGFEHDNFTAEIDVVVDHTSTEMGDFAYGLAFRKTETGFYGFTISSRSNNWALFKEVEGTRTELASGVASDLGGLVRVDRLRVDAEGSTIRILLNGETLTEVVDDSLSSGDVGFLVETLDETLAHVHFDYLVIRPVDFN